MSNREFRAAALAARIASTAEYERRVAAVRLVVAGEGEVVPVEGVSYDNFLTYARVTWPGRNCARTLASYLAAIDSYNRDRRIRWGADDVADAYRVVAGLRATEAEKAPRGALTQEKLAVVREDLSSAGHVEVADALAVLWDIVGRSNDIALLTRRRVVLSGRGVMSVLVNNKLALYKKKEVGGFDAHVVRSEEAKAILLRQIQRVRHDDDLLFPTWDPRLVATSIRRCAEACGWPSHLVWDGPHCARHGAAADEMESQLASGATESEATEAVRRLSWRSAESARLYGRQHRAETAPAAPARKGAKRAMQAEAGARAGAKKAATPAQRIAARKRSRGPK